MTPIRRLDVPFEAQETWYFCGPAALSLVLRYHGINISQSDLAMMLGTNEAIGTKCADLVRVSRELGLRAVETTDGSIERLRAALDAGSPAIIYSHYPDAVDHGYGDLDHFHFDIVTGYGEGFFTHHDTDAQLDGAQPHREVSEHELLERWRAEGGPGRWMLTLAAS